MKTALALFAFAALTATANAVEYVTLKAETTRTLEVGALVGVTLLPIGQGFRACRWKHADGAIGNVRFAAAQIFQFPLAGITEITATTSLTLKTTSATQINAATPSAVLVLPAKSTGNHDVINETRIDLVTWTPFLSQTVNSADPARFFTTRVTKTPAP